MVFSVRDPEPYCQARPYPSRDEVTCWVAYVDGFGFTVAGYGRMPEQAVQSAARYAFMLLADPEYRTERAKHVDHYTAVRALGREVKA